MNRSRTFLSQVNHKAENLFEFFDPGPVQTGALLNIFQWPGRPLLIFYTIGHFQWQWPSGWPFFE